MFVQATEYIYLDLQTGNVYCYDLFELSIKACELRQATTVVVICHQHK